MFLIENLSFVLDRWLELRVPDLTGPFNCFYFWFLWTTMMMPGPVAPQQVSLGGGVCAVGAAVSRTPVHRRQVPLNIGQLGGLVGAGGTVVATTGRQLPDQIAGVGGVVCEHKLAGEDRLSQNAVAVAGVVDCCWVLLYGRSQIWKKHCVLNLLSKSTSLPIALPFSHEVPFIIKSFLKPVLRIRNILVRIRIRGSIPLTNGSGSWSCYFSQCPSRRQQKFFPYYLLKVHLNHFSKTKSHKTYGPYGTGSCSGSATLLRTNHFHPKRPFERVRLNPDLAFFVEGVPICTRKFQYTVHCGMCKDKKSLTRNQGDCFQQKSHFLLTVFHSVRIRMHLLQRTKILGSYM